MKKLGGVLFGVLSLLAAGQAHSQEYPNRPIRWIVPFAAGGPSDSLARAIAPRLSENLKVPVTIENRPGAGGGVGTEVVAKASPDGYTIGLGATATHSINPHLLVHPTYDTLKDFAPITPLVSYVLVLVCNPGIPAKSVGELVAYAKTNPDKVSFASGGNGASNHLTIEILKGVTGAPIVHVPYKGNAPAMVDVVAGHTSCLFEVTGLAMAQVRAGAVRALAVTSSKRSAYAADVPTMTESGVPGFSDAGNDLWFGVLAPAHTPKPILDRLHAEITKALKSPEVIERMQAQAYQAWTLTPEEFAAFIRDDYERWGKVVEASGAKSD